MSPKIKSILQIIKSYLLYANITEEEFEIIREDIHLANRKSLRSFTIVIGGISFAMLIVSLLSGLFLQMRMVYLSEAVVCTICFLGERCLSENSKKAINALIHLFIISALAFGISLGTFAAPNELAVSYIAIMMLVPLLFNDRPIRVIAVLAFSVVVFIVTSLYTKSSESWVTDITNAVVFCIASSIIGTYMLQMKFERYVFEREVILLSENDLLTGLRNRNSYEQSLRWHVKQSHHTISCVYADVNGLHELNNSYGHEAGDGMLRYVGAAMQKHFGKRGSYRIGGDEFVALLSDVPEEELRNKIEEFREDIERASYHISIGAETVPVKDVDIQLLIKKAEKLMYQEKARFWKNSGIDRRYTRAGEHLNASGESGNFIGELVK